MTSRNVQQITAIDVLPNISRSKDNQAMELSQFVEYNMRNIFFQKSCRK